MGKAKYGEGEEGSVQRGKEMKQTQNWLKLLLRWTPKSWHKEGDPPSWAR